MRYKPSAEVNSVSIMPQPPSSLMKRRKTVSVTPAIGARRVAGAISTLPMRTDCGTTAPAGARFSTGFSQNFCTVSILQEAVGVHHRDTTQFTHADQRGKRRIFAWFVRSATISGQPRGVKSARTSEAGGAFEHLGAGA